MGIIVSAQIKVLLFKIYTPHFIPQILRFYVADLFFQFPWIPNFIPIISVQINETCFLMDKPLPIVIIFTSYSNINAEFRFIPLLEIILSRCKKLLAHGSGFQTAISTAKNWKNWVFGGTGEKDGTYILMIITNLAQNPLQCRIYVQSMVPLK